MLMNRLHPLTKINATALTTREKCPEKRRRQQSPMRWPFLIDLL
jgi:hypothetical protein